jgi:hypothetical protein
MYSRLKFKVTQRNSADGLHHYKETEKGRDIVCEKVERYAKKYAKERVEENRIKTLTQNVKVLMKNTSFTMEQAFNSLEISETDRTIISEQLQV